MDLVECEESPPSAGADGPPHAGGTGKGKRKRGVRVKDSPQGGGWVDERKGA